jgi:hypothetical protein
MNNNFIKTFSHQILKLIQTDKSSINKQFSNRKYYSQFQLHIPYKLILELFLNLTLRIKLV